MSDKPIYQDLYMRWKEAESGRVITMDEVVSRYNMLLKERNSAYAAGVAAERADGDKLSALLEEAHTELLMGRVMASGAAGWISLPKRIAAAIRACGAALAEQVQP